MPGLEFDGLKMVTYVCLNVSLRLGPCDSNSSDETSVGDVSCYRLSKVLSRQFEVGCWPRVSVDAGLCGGSAELAQLRPYGGSSQCNIWLGAVTI